MNDWAHNSNLLGDNSRNNSHIHSMGIRNIHNKDSHSNRSKDSNLRSNHPNKGRSNYPSPSLRIYSNQNDKDGSMDNFIQIR